MRIKEVFKDLNENELRLLRNSFDIIGDIAIVEVDERLKKYEKRIADFLLDYKNIKTVVKKVGGHKGVYRLQRYKFLGGVDKRETIYKENGVKIKLDIEKVYFSPRLGNERLRIARLVKDLESVLVMFSGCGVYPLVIARNSRAEVVYGVEINKGGCRYAEENLGLNNIKKVRFFCGDIRKFKLDKKFDRIVMPLPKGGKGFLKDAKRFLKKGGIVHYYIFSDSDYENDIKKVFRKYKILNIIGCGEVAPRVYRLCIDFKV